MREAILLAVGRLVCTSPWFVICCVPFYPKRRVSRLVMAVVITVSSILFFLCNFFFRLIDNKFASYGSVVFSLLYLVMVSFFIWGFRAGVVKLLYVFFLVQAVSTAINYSAAVLLKPLYKTVRISLQRTPGYILAIFLLTAVLYPFMWHFFSHQLREATEELRDKDFLMLCIPPIFIFLITQIFSDMSANPAIPQEKAIAIYLLISASGLVTYYLNVRLALDTVRRIRLETEVSAMERQIVLQAQNYVTLTKNMEDTRTARHDLRHHLAAMCCYVEKGDMEGLSLYLSEYRNGLSDENEPSLCRNDAVDAVVRYYLKQARKAGARLDVKLDLPSDMGIRDTDLTVLFGNLFENAAQSVARQKTGKKFIYSRCGIESGKLILTIDNSADRPGEKRNVPGIGQASVKAVMEKYNGTIRFEQKEEIYRVSALLSVPQKERGDDDLFTG